MSVRQHDLPSAASCVAQFIADIATLPDGRQRELASALMEEAAVTPAEALRKHLKVKPGRIPHYAALVIRELPYYRVLRHLEFVDGLGFFKRHADGIMDCIGDARAYYAFAGLMHLQGGERLGKELFQPAAGTEEDPKPMPAEDKLAELDEKMAADLIPVGSLLIREEAKSLLVAQMRATRAEQELKDAQLKWTKTQERMASEAQRAKAKAAEQAQGSADKSARAEIEAVQQKLDAEMKAHQASKAKLDAAEARLKEIEEQGGATPERVEEIRKEIQRVADQRIEDELSIAVRPWLVKVLEAEKDHGHFKATQSLSSQALAHAKAEVVSSDIIVNWEQDRERALKALEIEMTELDSLMIRIVKPSPELSKMHSELLQAMLTCRKQLNPAKPLGEVAKALIAGLKKVKDEELGDAAYAVRKLAEKGVFLGLEAETLIKIVEGEKQARYDLTHFKKSVQGRMIGRLHAGEPVDILIDGYNYMFTAHQHFGEKLKLNRNADGDAVFGEAGRAKLNKILRPLAEKFPHLDLHVFYDGLVKENRQPHPRITLWEPTFQRSGKGQADAEIAHVGLKRVRKGSMAVVVSNDKVVQRYADHFLSVRVFSDFIASH
jgi:hypothetical protein